MSTAEVKPSETREVYAIVERDDDMLICREHWMWGRTAIARRPKALTNEQWRPEAERIVAALKALTKD